MKSRNTLCVLTVLACLMCSGCGGPSNCISVDAGRPFLAQIGMQYGIEEGGITYQFNSSAYPNAQMLYVDPDRYYTLQPNRVYVMLMDPTYPAREAARQKSSDDFEDAMNAWGHSLDGMQDVMSSANRTMDNTLQDMRGTGSDICRLKRYQVEQQMQRGR